MKHVLASLALLACGGAPEPSQPCAIERDPDPSTCCESRAMQAELTEPQCFESEADAQEWLQLRQLALRTRECWPCP